MRRSDLPTVLVEGRLGSLMRERKAGAVKVKGAFFVGVVASPLVEEEVGVAGEEMSEEEEAALDSEEAGEEAGEEAAPLMTDSAPGQRMSSSLSVSWLLRRGERRGEVDRPIFVGVLRVSRVCVCACM